MKAELLPSILTHSFSELESQIQSLEGITHWVHVDFIDGIFVSGQTISLEDLARLDTILNIELHLMAVHPERLLELAQKARAKRVIVHLEAMQEPNPVLHEISTLGMKRAIAINPETTVDKVVPYLSSVDQVTVMGVNPGASGQTMIPNTIQKVRDLSQASRGVVVGVDGGVTLENVAACREAGASRFVSHNAVFGSGNIEQAIKDFRTKIS